MLSDDENENENENTNENNNLGKKKNEIGNKNKSIKEFHSTVLTPQVQKKDMKIKINENKNLTSINNKTISTNNSTNESWICLTCTFQHHSKQERTYLQCAMCSTSRPALSTMQ